MMAHFLPRRAASLLNCADKYVFFVRAAAQADWHAMRRNQGLPLRVLLLMRLPALSLLPGQTPAQLARWAAVGNCVTSMPISAMKLHAATRSTPGTVVQRSNASARSRCSLPISSSRASSNAISASRNCNWRSKLRRGSDDDHEPGLSRAV